MARLESVAKMGFYPTPEKTLHEIAKWVEASDYGCHYLDPCCGEGVALRYLKTWEITTWGIELDMERAQQAANNVSNIIQGSIFDARINPLGCMGLLWLNPPYDSEEGERLEMKFLKHSIKWLIEGGVLIFIVPEHVLQKEAYREWIGQHFRDIRVYRIHKTDYPLFKQVVLFGYKRPARVEEGEEIVLPPYPHIEDVEPAIYVVPGTEGPKVFQCGTAVTDEEIARHNPGVWEQLEAIMGKAESIDSVSPLFPLRKGHLVALLTSGVLDGRLDNPDGSYLVVKGYSERTRHVREEDDREITTDTYRVSVRVIEVTQGGARWYDIT